MSESHYLWHLNELLKKGVQREGRNGGTRGLFGTQMRFDLREGFPLLTTKKVHMKSVIVELLWFLRGDSNIKFLKEHNVSIWDEWADAEGELGPVYGMQWRSWPDGRGGFIDQISKVIQDLKSDPYSRRHIVSAWNVAELDDMALPPCHAMFQFCVIDGRLHLQLYQRSADWFLGVPFNIASYALLLILVAKHVGLEPGEFVHTFGDYHLYDNHIEQAKIQLDRAVKKLPTMVLLNDRKTIFDYELSDFALDGYDPHPAISAPVSA